LAKFRKGLKARVTRLRELACGLAREVMVWNMMLGKEHHVALSSAEREEYLAAIRRASRALYEVELPPLVPYR
jgi:hypothetical protein